ncbi:dihydrolipoamide dehydrogenase [Thermoanaerobacter ethanolicus JW 200]|uniref:dihydrolipoyl dehydrogenase n=1 Tax=Thermoanaerobacter ethanolicus TaxID=1757 RepID=UPI000202E175|nr:dihydrolipoamide dehydrogenase [Thermoanaerobacter ethanolicus JW 200]
MRELKYDVVVIGGGPGGTPGANMLAKKGLKVALVEKGVGLGGTCLFEGCIPSKIYIETATRYSEIKNSSKFGITLSYDNISVDFGALKERKEAILKARVERAEKIAKMNKLDIYYGVAQITDKNSVEVDTRDEKVKLLFDKLIIATGSETVKPPISGINLPGVIFSEDIFKLEAKPDSIAIIGGGYIGVEIASMFARVDTKVIIIEALPRILATEDVSISEAVTEGLKNVNVDMYTDAKVSVIEKEGELLKVNYKQNGEDKTVQAEKVLVAVGRRPRTKELNLDVLNIKLGNHGEIPVNEYMQTENINVYATGDVNGRIMLAHAATRESIIAAKAILGEKVPMTYNAIPHAIFSEPEAASVGIDTTKAHELGYKVVRYSYAEDARALIVGDKKGFVQIIADPKTHKLYGMQIVGKGAGELIAEATQVIRMNGKVEDITATIHTHPTLSEIIAEAAEKALSSF